jgi:hypothetical protein
MCGGQRDRSVVGMTYITPIRSLAGAVIAVLLCALAVAVTSAQAKGETQTLRVFSKQMKFTYTAADGTVTHGPPAGQPQTGDMFEIDSLDFRGTHKRHSKKAIGADYLQCVFQASGEPDCHGYTAIGRSLLRFHGMDLIGAIGRFKDAKILSNKEVKGGNDFVVELTRR